MFWSGKRTGGRRASRRRLSFEQCESRRLMAVTTSLSGGTLTINGDGTDDDVAIVGTANPGEIMVIGRNGTLVDGVAADMDGNSIVTIQGVTADLDATFFGGDDIINVDNVYLAGEMLIDTRTGEDSVVFGATGVVSTAGDCRVTTGGGGEEVDVFRAESYKVFIGGNLNVNSGKSARLIGASAAGAINVLEFAESYLDGVTSGNFIDVRPASTMVNGIALFRTSASSLIRVGMSTSVYIDTCYSGGAIEVPGPPPSFVHPGPPGPTPPGKTITIARCQADRISVRTPGGDDTVFVYGNSIVGTATNDPELSIDTGDGNDNVTASYNVVLGDVFMSLAGLNDTVILVGNLVTGFASADGGTGGNLLILLGNQFGGSAFVQFQ
ncbi:MAG: hypothetical protein WD894_21720 [Pirellulales bacterium]